MVVPVFGYDDLFWFLLAMMACAWVVPVLWRRWKANRVPDGTVRFYRNGGVLPVIPRGTQVLNNGVVWRTMRAVGARDWNGDVVDVPVKRSGRFRRCRCDVR